ncbi:hypothetical protein C8R44DRAFT_768272 [Mycena epipterygia]|nr:hypothetical protein C8R44DRAFT_768272 [Mycena epipterygia]
MYPPHAPMLPPELVDLVISNLRSCYSQNFLDFLNSPYNTFFFRLRGLHAIGFPYTDTIQLYPVLPTFSYLRELHIYGKNLMFHNDALNPPLPPHLEFLSLTTAIFPSYPKLTAFLSQFPALKGLKLINVTCHAYPDYTQQDILKLDLITLFITPGSELTLKFHTESQLSIFSEKPCCPCPLNVRRQLHPNAPRLERILKKLMHSRLDQLVFVAVVEVGGFAPSPSSHDAIELLDGVGFAGLTRIEFYGPWDSVDDILGKQFKSAISALLPCQTARGIMSVGIGLTRI